MSDLSVTFDADGLDLVLDSQGEPGLTSGLTPAALLSILVPDYWGNAVAEEYGEYLSRMQEIMDGPLTNKARLAVIDTIKNALAWMQDAGMIGELSVIAEIENAGRLNIAVRLERPSGPVDFRYAINWDAQEVQLL
jgi:phage gp46-like protein